MSVPPNLPEVHGITEGHRRMVRTIRTKELAIRARSRRKAAIIRTGILALFVLSMVVYPMNGTLSPAANAAETVPGVVRGVVPDTIEVVMGSSPGLLNASLPLPDLDSTAHYLAISSEYIVTPYLPNCDGHTPTDLDSLQNGNIPEEDMCVLWDGDNKVRADAAVALAEFNHVFKQEFGHNLCIISSYRTLGDQVRMKRERGHLAAAVGQSYHGWGLAIDLCPGYDKGEYKAWIDEIGPTYGWINPAWARSSMWEPWHYEYYPGTAKIGWASHPGSYLAVPDTSVPDPSPTETTTTEPEPEPEPEPSPEPSPEPDPEPSATA